jgi:fructoselysine 6-kinase
MDRFAADGSYHPGGNALNQAVRFRAAGAATAFLGGLGDDPAGDRILALLRERGVDSSRVRRIPGPTASNRLYNDAAGERYGEEGAWNNGAYGEYRLTAADWAWLDDWPVWSTHANGPDYREALARAGSGPQARPFLAVDFLHLDDMDLLEASLPAVSIAYFGGTSALEAPLAAVAARRGALVVLTLGSGGSVAFDGPRVYRQAALPVDKVVDATGCGDAFQAAFTLARLSGADVPAALLAGAEAGRRTCRRLGALGDLGE